VELTQLRAEWDPAQRATLSGLRELHYCGERAELLADDLPPYVRAVSALRRWQGRTVFVQDDVNALVSGEPNFGGLEPLLLPRGRDLRRRFEKELGNKQAKLDLEAAAVLPDGRLLVLGSGSTRAREQLVLVQPNLELRLVPGAPLYQGLRDELTFAGSELNLEGALVVGSYLRLLQRGNGATHGELGPVNAFGDLALAEFLAWLDDGAEPPRLRRITQLQLGDHQGAALSITDAAFFEAGNAGQKEGAPWVITASAEASPNTVDDGAVACSCVGLMNEGRLRLTPLVDERGRVLPLKVEGIEPRPGRLGEFDVVVDVDDANKPALLGTLHYLP
jgi:hypothetical protein